MYGENLEQELRYYFQREVQRAELSAGWWSKIVTGVITKRPRSPRFGFWPKTRLGLALVPVALLLMGGTVYSATLLGRDYFSKMAPGISEAGLAQVYDLEQTTNGITVRLERAYADANVVLVGFTISGPKHNYYISDINLSTTEGQNLSGLTSLIGVPKSDLVIGDWQPSERNACVYSFDAAAMQGMPSELDLELTIAVTDSATAKEGQNVVGSFAFDFSVASHGGKIISIGQTTETSGVTITLEKIIVSPWATRAVIQVYPASDERGSRAIPLASINFSDGSSVKDNLGHDTGTYHEDYFAGDFTSQSGEWTVTVNELVYPPMHSDQQIQNNSENDTKRVTGPWIFHFQVP